MNRSFAPTPLHFHGATFIVQDVQCVEEMAHASGGHRQPHLIIANDMGFGHVLQASMGDVMLFISETRTAFRQSCGLRLENMSSNPSQAIAHAGSKTVSIVFAQCIITLLIHCSLIFLNCQSDEVAIDATSMIDRLRLLNQGSVDLSCHWKKVMFSHRSKRR